MSTSCNIKEVSWSKSEGSLLDLDDGNPPRRSDWTDGKENELDLKFHWPGEYKQDAPSAFKTNPFWNELSASNPFLDDVAQSSNREKNNKRISILKEDPDLFFRDSNNRNSAASSGDELNIDYLFLRKMSKRSAKYRSASDLLDIVGVKTFELPHTSSHILPPENDSLQTDREAYKTAWLNQRQLARSCLDLNVINQSPGWAQTQSIETHIMCKVNHEGSSVQLPDSDIAVHFPEGHVAFGEFQEVGLQTILDSPPSLNHEFSTTVSPLIELTLSNLNTTEAILLEMKIAAEVKKDPFSQVMAEIVCLCGFTKEGPFEKIDNCYIYKDMIQVKLTDLSHLMYIVTVAQTNTVNSPSASVWEYIHRKLSVGIYGPKHIHPSFTAVFALFSHNYVPEKLTVSDIKKGGKSMPPVVFQMWGKHTFVLEKPQDLNIFMASCDPDFEVKEEEHRKEIKEGMLKGGGKVIHQHFPFSIVNARKIHLFVFRVQVKVPNNNLVCQFYITTPEPAPKPLTDVSNKPNRLEKRKEIKSAPLLSVPTIKYPLFQEKPVHVTSYGVALKTVLRQSKIDYLLEYFKGDTIALLGEDKVKAIGQAKIKDWYVGILRRKVGLVHCKNIKVIAKDQAIDIEDSTITTQNLLEQITLPFRKLTYIYSAILSTVSEKMYDWKALADALGFSHMSLDDFTELQAEKEPEKVAYVVKKLKEVCHTNRSTRRFLYELSVALLKLDCQGLLARITQDTVIFTSAVKLGKGWRELAEKLARLTKQQIEAYEIPHRNKSGEVPPEMMWKPAYDFLYTWGAHYGDSYRDMLQDLQSSLDKMKNPVTKQWRELTGALILVNSMEVLRVSAFSRIYEE
ncbi:metastasis-associated in colon cancer protein 1 [Hemicordylus capensis]|uniref:metastasis-associated in colon cancer protein 1 n=1 Tax=Hemicordylus capensis TaxID=884348 RepID=UPI002303D88A|nr:metastasis-associated in colon cancer protein 1 [Hemicordylus capensis]XP_053119984.1 metastasis-associated in colon cancer protein 1 [Hemicordylus capensis]